MNLSTKQYLVLDYIKRFISEKNYSPSIREIMNGLLLKSPATVHEHLKKLADKGYITFSPTKSRTIELLVENEYTNIHSDIVSLPLINSDEKIKVPTYMLNGLEPSSLLAYKEDNVIYIINKEDEDSSNKLSLYEENNNYSFINTLSNHLVGTIISKFEIL